MLPAGCAAANSPHATSAASAATGPVALEEEVRPPSAAAPVTPVKQRGDLDSTPVGAAVGTNTRHRGGSANVYGTPQPSHHAVAVPGAGSTLGTPAALTSTALATSSVAATEPTTTEPTAALTTRISGAGSTPRISGWAALPSDLQAHVFTYLTARRHPDLGPAAGPLATIDFLALAATCSSAWAIYSAAREQLWRAALGHRVKVSGGPGVALVLALALALALALTLTLTLANPNQVSGGPADRDWRALHRLLCGTLDDGIEARGWADSSDLENAAEVRGGHTAHRMPHACPMHAPCMPHACPMHAPCMPHTGVPHMLILPHQAYPHH